MIAVLGLTFKPETDDMREAASLTIIPALQEGGAIIKATDPKGIDEATKVLKDIEFCDDPYSAAETADAVIILTEWNEYRALDLKRVAQIMKGDVFIDLKNIYEPEIIMQHGFNYIGVGV